MSADPSHRAQAEPTGIDERLFVGSVEKAMQVLRVFGRDRSSLSFGAIAAAAGLGKSAAQRFVYTLHMLGYLRQDPTTRHYSLSPKVLELSHAYLGSDPLVERAQPHLAAANRACGEAVNLSELIDTEVVVVARFMSRHVVAVNVVPGQKFPAFCSAAGRAILAQLPEAAALDIIDRSERRAYTPFTLTGRAALKRQLHEDRTQGYTIADQQMFLGDISTAAPILDAGGRVVAAVNIAGAASRWTVESVRQTLTPIVVDTARAVSHALGLP